MKDIAIYGAGGFGREIACLLRRINEASNTPEWNLIGFFDDGKPIDWQNEYGKVLGGLHELNAWPTRIHVVIAIGSSKYVKKIADSVSNPNVEFPNIVYGLSLADKNNYVLGRGNIITGNTFFSCNVKVGNFNVFNGSIVLGHDVSIQSYNIFMPAVRVSGEVSIGNENFFGVGSIILQQLTIGDNIKLGAGSVLMHKPKDNGLYIGNPAKIFKY